MSPPLQASKCRFARPLLLGLLALGLVMPLQAAEPAVDQLGQAALQNAFQILRGEYIRGEEITADELNRAAMQGLLQRLDLGAELVARTEAPAAKGGLVAEEVSPGLLYLRPQALTGMEAAAVNERLAAAKAIRHLILDLRAPMPPGDFEAAAALLEAFVPAGELLFKLQQPGRDDARLFLASEAARWTGPLVVLVDAETNNLGETIAAALRARGRALLVGAPTRGATVRYETLPLDDHWQLRFARAEMLLPDGTSFFRKGLTPDYPVTFPAEAKRRLFASARAPKQTVFEVGRPRYNEAALLARRHPELESYIRRSAGETVEDDRAPDSDRVLQRAVDMLLASDQLGGSRLRWPSADRPAAPKPAAPPKKP
jgi:hypothetical protein